MSLTPRPSPRGWVGGHVRERYSHGNEQANRPLRACNGREGAGVRAVDCGRYGMAMNPDRVTERERLAASRDAAHAAELAEVASAASRAVEHADGDPRRQRN